MISRDTITTFVGRTEVRKEYSIRGWFCRTAGIWLSGPWRTRESAILAAQQQYAGAREADTLDWRATKKAG